MLPSDRYSRQILVKKIKNTGQKKLNQTSVLIVGIGGLGCQVASQLAGAGMGRITVVDHDVISLSNLHRQILFRESDIGKPKASIAAKELKSINSDIEIIHHNKRASLSNLAELANGATFIIDAADNFITSFILSDYCSINQLPLLSASVNKTFGWVGIFCGTEQQPAPSLRDIFNQLNQQQGCDTVGVTGPSVGIIASIQAQEALKIALNDKTSLVGKLLYLDLWNYNQHLVDFSNAPTKNTNTIQLLNYKDVREDDIIVDVRNLDEQDQTPFSFNNVSSLPLSLIETQIHKLPQEKRLVCACISGQRAMIAAQILTKQGFNDVSVLIPK